MSKVTYILIACFGLSLFLNLEAQKSASTVLVSPSQEQIDDAGLKSLLSPQIDGLSKASKPKK